MAITAPPRPPADRADAGGVAPVAVVPATSPLASIATLTAGLAWIALFAHDGSATWRVVRALAAAAVTIGLLARSGTPGASRGRWMLLAGTLTTVAGAGIGVPFLVKGGAATTTVIGLGLLLAGVVMLGVAAGDLLGRLRTRRRRAAGAVAGVVALAIAAWTVVPAVMATNVPRPELGDRTPLDIGAPYDDVEFTTADDVALSAWYVPSRNGAAVVVRHGASSTRTDVLDQAAVLVEHGYGVLLVDARGHGRSGGRAMEYGWYGTPDVSAAVSFVATLPDVDPDRIAVLGMSMGGEEAIGAAGADPRIRAVVAEGATGRVDRDFTWLSDEYGARGWVQEQLFRVGSAVTDVLTDADRPVTLTASVARAAPRPILLVTAGAVPDEGAAAARMAQVAPGTVTIWTVEGAGHTDGLAVDPDGWERRVIAFLDAALG